MATVIIAFLMFISSSAFSSEGWQITTRYYNKYENPELGRVEEVVLASGYMKMITNNLTTVFDINNGKIIYINPTNQLYWSGSPDRFNIEIRSELEAMIEKRLYGVERESQDAMREMYTEMLNASFPQKSNEPARTRKFAIKKDKENEKIFDFNATSYKISEEGMHFETIWISNSLPVYQVFDFVSLSHFLGQLAPGAYAESFESSTEYFNLVEKGYPVKVEMYRSDGTIQISEVIRAKKINVSPVDFQVPKGFSQATLTDVGVWDGFQ